MYVYVVDYGGALRNGTKRANATNTVDSGYDDTSGQQMSFLLTEFPSIYYVTIILDVTINFPRRNIKNPLYVILKLLRTEKLNYRSLARKMGRIL